MAPVLPRRPGWVRHPDCQKTFSNFICHANGTAREGRLGAGRTHVHLISALSSLQHDLGGLMKSILAAFFALMVTAPIIGQDAPVKIMLTSTSSTPATYLIENLPKDG